MVQKEGGQSPLFLCPSPIPLPVYLCYRVKLPQYNDCPYKIKFSGILSGSKSIKMLSLQWRHFYPHMGYHF